MKYWILTTEFPPFHGGGISTYCLQTGLMFSEQGHDVTVFVPEESLPADMSREHRQSIAVIRFKPDKKEHFKTLGYNAALSFQFAELVLEEISLSGPPDFIEMQDYHGIGYYLLMQKKLGAAALRNIPMILTAHAPSFFYLRHNQAPVYALPDFWTGEMEKWTMKAADILISPSKYLVDKVEDDLGKKAREYNIVRNPYQLQGKVVPERQFTQGDVVFFGKLTYQKGSLQLLRYMNELWDDGFDQHLVLIGGDHHFEPMQASMKDHLIRKFNRNYEAGRFSFEGKLTPAELNVRLSKAQVIIVPSIVDNFPYAVVESMLLGKVLLVSDGGGQAEMITDGISGFIYKHDDSRSFAKKLKYILGLTAAQYNVIGDNARASITNMCNYDTVYKQKMAILANYNDTVMPAEFPFVNEISKSEPLVQRSFLIGKLTVVVPYYNTGDYIRETIQNLYEVKFGDMEILVVNDGSDDPLSISEIYSLQQEYGFEIITQTNKGLAAARNAGANRAKGEFIAFLDADDKIAPDFYQRAISILREYPQLSFVSSWVRYFDGAEGIWPAQHPEPPFMLLHNMVNAGFLCRTIDYINFGKNDPGFEYGMEDYDSNLSLLSNGCRGVVIPEPLYYYRIHSASMARGFNKFNQLYLYRLLSEKHRSLYEKYAVEVFNLLVANGPSYLYDNPTVTPATDILDMRKWINELETSNRWYHNTLRNYEHEYLVKPEKENDKGIVQRDFLHDRDKEYTTSGREIQEWYNKEYEVLPIWYKRFGHIIKVFQGQRSVKSLFEKTNKTH